MTPSNEKAAGAGAVELQTVAWRIKHPSEPGMLGHYPWTYTEREKATRRESIDVEALVRRTEAESALKLQADRIAELEKDAARYRWLRSSGMSDTYVMVGCDFKGLCMEGLDDAVDAHMEGAQEKDHG